MESRMKHSPDGIYYPYRTARVIGGITIPRTAENEKSALRSMGFRDDHGVTRAESNHSVYGNKKMGLYVWFSDSTIYIGPKVEEGRF